MKVINVAAGLVFRTGTVLITQRHTHDHLGGLWEFPGGKCEPGETFDVALRREVREETGLDIELRNVVGAFGFELAEVRVAMLCMEAEPIGGVLCLSEEHDEFAWVSIGELANWKLTAGLKEMAAAYARVVSHGRSQVM